MAEHRELGEMPGSGSGMIQGISLERRSGWVTRDRVGAAIVGMVLLYAIYFAIRLHSMLAWYENDVVPVRNAVRMQQEMQQQPAAAPAQQPTAPAAPTPKK